MRRLETVRGGVAHNPDRGMLRASAEANAGQRPYVIGGGMTRVA